MSRFTVTNIPYEPPQARNANNVGAIFDAYETASATVNEENFAEEGLTARVFEASVAQAYVGHVARVVPTTFNAPFLGAWVRLVLNATDMRVTVGALAAGEAYRVSSYLDVVYDPDTLVDGDSMDVWFRHVWDPTGGGGVKVTGSQWWRRWKLGAGPNGFTPLSTPLQGQHCPVMMESWIFGPAGIVASWVEIQYQFAATAAAASLTVLNGIIVVDRFKQVEVR